MFPSFGRADSPIVNPSQDSAFSRMLIMSSTAFVPPVAFRGPKSTASRSKRPPTCSAAPVPRRRALQVASLAVATTLLPSLVRSESMYEKNVRKDVAKVAAGRAKVEDLKKIASSWKDVMDEDDGLYVLRFIPIWLEPARIAMENVAKQESVDVGDAGALQTKAVEMMGHLLELRTESKARKKAGVVRELDEMVETADDFLNLPGIKRFVL